MSVVTESEILASCLKSRKAYDVAHDLIPIDDFTPMGMRVFSGIGRYYELDEDAEKVDAGLLYKKLEPSFANKEHKKQLHECIEDAKGMEVSPANVISLALDMRRQSIGYQLAEGLLNDEADIELLEEYNKIVQATDLSQVTGDELHGVDLLELMEVIDPNKKVKFAPNSLNERLDGGLVAGDSMIIAGRPNAGKTATVVTALCSAAFRGKRVLYLNNEDPVRKVIVRCISCLTGKTQSDMLANPKETMELARERGYDNIVFCHMTPGTDAQVRAMVRKHKAEVFVVDQILNLKHGKSEGVERLEQVGRAVRNIAGEFNAISIGVTQCGESAEGKLRLSMNDLYGSNTALQGACDIIILIGVDNTFEANHSRMMNLVKDKQGMGIQSWTVKINEKLSRIYDE